MNTAVLLLWVTEQAQHWSHPGRELELQEGGSGDNTGPHSKRPSVPQAASVFATFFKPKMQLEEYSERGASSTLEKGEEEP